MTFINVDSVGSGAVVVVVGALDCKTLRRWSVWSSVNLLSMGGFFSSIFAVASVDVLRSCWSLLSSLGCKSGHSNQSQLSQVPGIEHTHRGSPSVTF